MTSKAKYIVIEGPQGVGKTTQIEILHSKFKAAGFPVRIFREPDTQTDLTARAIRTITQNPEYPLNSRTEILLYNAARSQTLKIIEKFLKQGIYCLVDRSYLTTLAVQYYGRQNIRDYNAINEINSFAVDGIEPDLCIVLDAPTNILKARLKLRNGGDRYDNLDESFLERVRAGYLWESKQRNFPVIYSVNSEEETAQEIWQKVQETLSQRNTKAVLNSTKVSSVAEIIDELKTDLPKPIIDPQISDQKPLVEHKDDKTFITLEGREYLKKIVTNVDNNVYSFYLDELSPVTIAASMARLSRRGDDLRTILLDEFSSMNSIKDQQLLSRIITAYGDDSVQQLGGIHLVVEDASNLLTKKLEWGRLGAYLEQSTRYIFYDQKDSNNKYKYYIPDNLKKTVQAKYVSSLNQIFDVYSVIVKKLVQEIRINSKTKKADQDGAWKNATKAQACDAARGILPVATKSTVGIYMSAQALESLIFHLQSDNLLESRKTGEQLLKEARKIIPMFLERADKPDRGGAMVAYMAENRQNITSLSKKLLSSNYTAGEQEDVTLVDYFPKNELDLISDMLYAGSDLSLADIKKQVADLSYDQKVEIFSTYIGERLNRRQRPGRALENAHYSWDLVCDYGIFRDLQRHRMVDDLEWQELNPRLGYEIPKLIEKYNLSELYEKAFDISLELYSYLQKHGYKNESQYATLLGNKMRWKISYNAREAMHLHELRTSPQGHPEYRRLVKKMHGQLSNVHPLLAASMIYVNKDEDPKLNRLAAEKYTQFKLQTLK